MSPSILPGPAKGNADSDKTVVVEDSGSKGDQDGESIMGMSKDNADQDDDKSNSETDLWEGVTNSSPESVTGDDCLT